MIVKILGLLAGADTVRVAAPWGNLQARWRSREPAAVGERWIVETDTERTYDWSEVRTGVAALPGIRQIRDFQNLVTGTIADLDDNGILTVQYGDYLLMVEVSNPPTDVTAGEHLSLTIDDLQLWPHDRL